MNDRPPRENLMPATASAARLIVPGMGSDHCAGLVSTSLKLLEGVANIRTNIANHHVDEEFNPRQPANGAALPPPLPHGRRHDDHSRISILRPIGAMTVQSFAPKYLRNKATALPAHRGLFERLGLLALAAAALMFSGVAIAYGQTSPWQQGAFVYTADEHGSSISAIDLAAGRVSTFPIPISPHNVQVTADGKRLLAVGEPAADGHGHAHGGNEHGANEGKGRLLILDTARLGAKPVAEIFVGAHPAHVIADQRGERAFVTNAGDNTVSVVDLAAGKLIATISTGRYPHGLRMSPDGRELYVANVQDGTVSVIDADGLTELARIPVGATPVQVGFTPDGSRVYVSLRDENRVGVIDTATRSLIGSTIEVGRNPIQVHATPDGRFVYVANQGSDAEPADTVSVIEVSSGKVVNTIRTGMGAHGVVVSDDGAWVFITNIVDGTVSAIDVATGKVVADFIVGRGPNGITFRPLQG